MDVNELIRTISLIVAPAVMISCCTVFLNGQMQRYDSIGTRMRLMNQERFEILRTMGNGINLDTSTSENVADLRVREIEAQLPHLLNRYKLLRDASLTIGLAILLYVICMFIIALATVMHSNLMATLALFTFLMGMLPVFVGGIMVMLEIFKSHLSVRYEVLHALSFGEKTPTLTLPHKIVRIPRFSH